MLWIAAAVADCIVYLAAVSLLGIEPRARRWSGDIGLLLSPVLPVAIVIARRRVWNGRALIYWATVAIGDLRPIVCATWSRR